MRKSLHKPYNIVVPPINLPSPFPFNFCIQEAFVNYTCHLSHAVWPHTATLAQSEHSSTKTYNKLVQRLPPIGQYYSRFFTTHIVSADKIFIFWPLGGFATTSDSFSDCFVVLFCTWAQVFFQASVNVPFLACCWEICRVFLTTSQKISFFDAMVLPKMPFLLFMFTHVAPVTLSSFIAITSSEGCFYRSSKLQSCQ